MIISHKHKYIFVAIPKTGTHAIRFALREFLGENDLEQVGLFVQRRFPFKQTAHIKHGHIKCKEIKEVLGSGVWQDYFKFSFVRNPWDRYISYCFFMHRNNREFLSDPYKYLQMTIDDTTHHDRIHFIAQHEFIYDDVGNPMVDYVGRYEDLQNSYKFICKEIGIPYRDLVKVNSSKHLPYRQYYDMVLTNKVGRFYQRDVELLNYTNC